MLTLSAEVKTIALKLVSRKDPYGQGHKRRSPIYMKQPFLKQKKSDSLHTKVFAKEKVKQISEQKYWKTQFIFSLPFFCINPISGPF